MRPTALTLTIVLGVVAMTVAPLPATASRSTPDPSEDSVAYHFLSAVIGSLSRSNNALQRVSQHLKDPSAIEQMTAIKIGSGEIRIAAAAMQEFSTSKNEQIREAAKYLAASYGMIDKALAFQLDAAERLAAVKTEDDLVPIRRAISDAKATLQQSTDLLYDATALAWGSCVVADPKDANRTALDVTRSEKARLLTKLETEFGPSLKTKPKGDDTGSLNCARLLLKGLGNPQWRVAR